MEPEAKKDQQKKNLEKLHELTARVLSAAGVCFAMGALAWVWIYVRFHKQLSSLSDFGAFGSYLQGTVGSLWALAGVLLIFVAFLAQRRQLIQQDAELEDQKVQFKHKTSF